MQHKFIELNVLAVFLISILCEALPVYAQEAESTSPPLLLERYTSVVKPERSVLIAASVDGLLWELGVEQGDKVGSGQVLGKLDDRVQAAVLESGMLRFADTSRVEQAVAEVSILEFDLRKASELYEKGVANKREVDIAKVKLEEAEALLGGALAEREQLKADLAVERERLESLYFVAPFSGIVLERLAEPGSALRMGDGVFRIASLDPLRVDLPLPVELFGELQEGNAYELRAAAPVNTTLVAQLRWVRPEIDSASATFVATFEIANPELILPTGFCVHLRSPEPVAEYFMLTDSR